MEMVVETGKAERISSVLVAIALCQMLQRPAVAPGAGVALDPFVLLNKRSFLQRNC